MKAIKWFLLSAGLIFYLEKLSDDILAFHRHLDYVAIKGIDFPFLYDFAYWFTAEIPVPNSTPPKSLQPKSKSKKEILLVVHLYCAIKFKDKLLPVETISAVD
jgi:hypothetical protein